MTSFPVYLLTGECVLTFNPFIVHRLLYLQIIMLMIIYVMSFCSPGFESGIPQPAGACQFLIWEPTGLALQLQVGLRGAAEAPKKQKYQK